MYILYIREPGILFEWDESKLEVNLAKHYIDFQDAKRVFDGRFSREGNGVTVNVVRGTRRRIISARRANRNERQDYQNHLSNANEGQD